MEKPIKKKILIIFGLAFLALLAFAAIYTRIAPGTIYFDNGFDYAYEIYLDAEKVGEVKSKDFFKVENIKNGKHKIEIKNQDELFESQDVDVKGLSYIYNIGSKYTYLIVTYEYSKSGSALTAGSAKEIGNEKFFEMPSTDFELGQEPPETIEVTDSSAYLKKTALERKVEEGQD